MIGSGLPAAAKASAFKRSLHGDAYSGPVWLEGGAGEGHITANRHPADAGRTPLAGGDDGRAPDVFVLD
jgi:hypothetical protein